MKRSILMLSGGLDSVVLAYKLKHEGIVFDAIFFDAGKKSTLKELEYSRYVTNFKGERFEVVNISDMNKTFVGHVSSNFVALDELDRGSDTHIVAGKLDDEDSVTPSGFPILLSITSFLAQVSGREDIYIGITKEQADLVATTKDYFDNYGDHLSLLNTNKFQINVKTPFINTTKAEIILEGVKLGVDFTKSWSCMYDAVFHCGTCPRCMERKAAFKNSKVKDPTTYLA